MDKISSKSEVFEFSGGQKPTIRGGYMWPAMPIFELGRAIPVKSHVWKFLVRIGWPFKSYHLNFPGEQKPPIRRVTCDLRCPFSNLAELFQWKVMCENLVRIGWAFQELCPQTFFLGGRNPLLRGGGVTFDLWCPFSNSNELFHLKVMCWN